MDAAALVSAALDWETVDEEEEEEFPFQIEDNGLQVQSSEIIFLKIEPGMDLQFWIVQIVFTFMYFPNRDVPFALL